MPIDNIKTMCTFVHNKQKNIMKTLDYATKFETAPIAKTIEVNDHIRAKILIGSKGFVFMKVVKYNPNENDFLLQGTSRGKLCQMYVSNLSTTNRAMSVNNMVINLLSRTIDKKEYAF